MSERSPTALDHDPAVQRFDWVTERDQDGQELLDDVRARTELDDAGWERLLLHAGIHLNRQRIVPERLPELVPEGTSIIVYSFTKDPTPLVFDPDEVLLDEHGVVAVNKPPWWTVQGSRASRLSSLERMLQELLGCPELRPINRIDRETSGVTLFARHGRAASTLGKQLQARTVGKRYLAVVSPPPSRDAWTVSGRLVRIPHPAHSLFEHRPMESEEGRQSETRFRVLEVKGERALLEAQPVTGRTHQVRVHLQASESPIVGDSLYGVGWSPGRVGSATRLQLHASSLRFVLAKKERIVEAPPPGDFGLDAA